MDLHSFLLQLTTRVLVPVIKVFSYILSTFSSHYFSSYSTVPYGSIRYKRYFNFIRFYCTVQEYSTVVTNLCAKKKLWRLFPIFLRYFTYGTTKRFNFTLRYSTYHMGRYGTIVPSGIIQIEICVSTTVYRYHTVKIQYWYVLLFVDKDFADQ